MAVCLREAACRTFDVSLAVRMARVGGISVSRARELELALTEILRDGLMRDGEVRINGFGRIQIVERSAMVWDPRRRRRVRRKMRRVVRFRGAKARRKSKSKKSKCL